MTEPKQPEALELASAAESADLAGYPTAKKANAYCLCLLEDCAHMIRKLHAENESLRAERERNLHSIRVSNEIINKKNDELESLSTGYAAARLEIASLQAANLELERLCEATYVAKGADAYHHACEQMERRQQERAAAGKVVGTEGSLCDGLAWLYGHIAGLESQLEAARLEIESLRARSLPEIKDMHNGPQQLNLSDRAMWVLGWNECRDAARDAQPAGAQQPGAVYAALSDAEIDRIVPALEPVSEDFPAEWAVWKDRERIREELRASHGQAPAQAAPAAVAGPSDVVSIQRQAFIRGWDERGMAHQLKGTVETDERMRVLMDIYFPRTAAPTTQPAPQQEAQSALFDKQGFRAWVLHNLPDDTIIGSSAYWADHLSAWAQRFVKKAPQQEATDALARAEYYIDNPSAWSSFDQRISDDISAVTEALRAALAAPKPQQEAQEPVAWYVTGCGRLLDEYEAEAEARRIGGTAKAMPLYTVPQPSPASQGDALDAARYRWLRDSTEWEPFDSAWLNKHDIYGCPTLAMDAAIDAARAAQEGKKP